MTIDNDEALLQGAKMIVEKRRFRRVRFMARCQLRHKQQTFAGQLENISSSGVLVSLQGSSQAAIRPGEKCSLAITATEGELPLQFIAEVIHASFSLVGMKFIAMDAVGRESLQTLLRKASAEPVMLPAQLRRQGNEG